MVPWHIGESMGGIDEQGMERRQHQPLANYQRACVKA